MLEGLARHWWVFAVRGVAAILFGLCAWFWPGITVLALVMLFGAYALVDGAMYLAAAFGGGADRSRGQLVLAGACGILLGIVALAWPASAAGAMLLLIAAWAIVTGVLGIVAAIEMRKEIDNEWLYILSGALSVLMGVLLFMYPLSGTFAIVFMLGLASIVYGAFALGGAFRLHKLDARFKRESSRFTSGRTVQ